MPSISSVDTLEKTQWFIPNLNTLKQFCSFSNRETSFQFVLNFSLQVPSFMCIGAAGDLLAIEILEDSLVSTEFSYI